MSGVISDIRASGRRPTGKLMTAKTFGIRGRAARDAAQARSRLVTRRGKRRASHAARALATSVIEEQLAAEALPFVSQQPDAAAAAHLAAATTDGLLWPTTEQPLPRLYGQGVPMDWVKNRRRQPVPEQAAT